MKPRKLMVTTEVLTNIPSKEFSKSNMQYTFDEYFTDKNVGESLEVYRVRVQAVKENK